MCHLTLKMQVWILTVLTSESDHIMTGQSEGRWSCYMCTISIYKAQVQTCEMNAVTQYPCCGNGDLSAIWAAPTCLFVVLLNQACHLWFDSKWVIVNRGQAEDNKQPAHWEKNKSCWRTINEFSLMVMKFHHNRFSGLLITKPSWHPAAQTEGSTSGTWARSERSSLQRMLRMALLSCWSVRWFVCLSVICTAPAPGSKQAVTTSVIRRCMNDIVTEQHSM